MPPEQRSTSVPAELGPAVDRAARELEAAALGRAADRFGGSILGRLRRAGSYGQALELVEEERSRLRRLLGVVDDLEERLRDLQAREIEADPFGDAWRESVRGELAQAGEAGRREPAWTAQYARAFVAREFEACAWLSQAEEVRPEDELARRMLTAARAAQQGDLAGAMPALDTLTQADPHVLPPKVQARCYCMWARAVSRGLGDPARARDALRGKLSPPSPRWPRREVGLVRAALGECLLAGDDPEQADAEARLAQRMARDEPSGHVLRGLVAEAVGYYGRANECYDEAVAATGDRAVAGELFAPVPAGLLWRYGRRRRQVDPGAAVAAISRALQLGIKGGDDWPERKAYVDLAKALEADGNSKAAANAYWEAGRRYSWAGDEPTAVAFLAKAREFDDRTAVYQLEYAEALRLRSVRDDGTVDRRLLRQAAASWRAGMELQGSGHEVPWAYVTGALIAHEESGDLYRPRVSWPAASLLERGLMIAPGDVRVVAQLSQAHRLLGNRWTAHALTSAAIAGRAHDEIVFDQHLLALIDLGRIEEALRLLDEHGLPAKEPWLVNRKVQLLLQLGRPAEALELLKSSLQADASLHDLQVALCYRLLDRPDAARRAYQQVWDRLGSREVKRRGFLAGWAGYLLGRYDDAVDIYARLVDADPFDASLACELGQVLVARGRPEEQDLSRGEELLAIGIGMTRSAYALNQLAATELPLLLERVAGKEHAPAATEVVARAREQIRTQLKDLDDVVGAEQELEHQRERAGDAAEPDLVRRTVLAALARIAADDGRRDEALGHYAELAGGRDIPEALHGLRRTAKQICKLADGQAAAGDPAVAVAIYERLLGQLDRVPEAAPELSTSAHLRAALAGVQVEGQPGFAGHLAAALSPDRPAPDLETVVTTAVATPDHYWRVVDAARALAGSAAASETERDAAGRLLERLDLSVVLRTRRADVVQSRLFPLATPLLLHLGPGLLGVDEVGTSVDQQLNRIRREVERDTGVNVPVISVRPLPRDADPGAYEIDLFEMRVAQGSVAVAGLPEGARSPVEVVVDHVEAVVMANLARLFSIDDVGLWLGAVRSSLADADRLTQSDRLELLRLLRLLLREQVPIVDRDDIFEVVRKAEPGWSAVALLPAVRRRLAGRLALSPAADPPASWFLPEELEEELRAGLAVPETGVWQLPRDRAHALGVRLAAWQRSARADVVVVNDPKLRPFVWRLMVGLRQRPTRVLDSEELHERT